MDTIIVKTKEDMERILDWVHESLDLFENGPEFRIPFRQGEILMPYDGCRLEFQREAERCVRFKLHAIPEAFADLGWTQEMSGEDFTLGSFLFNVDTLDISGKSFNMSGAYAEAALSYEMDGELFKGLAFKWLALMLLAVYYRPQFESKRRIDASASSGKKGKKAKKSKRPKTLYTRTYVVDNDLTDKLPKPVKRHAKPDHEYGVRGHYRHCKSGKVTWVRPHVRCKGLASSDGSVYIAKVEET